MGRHLLMFLRKALLVAAAAAPAAAFAPTSAFGGLQLRSSQPAMSPSVRTPSCSAGALQMGLEKYEHLRGADIEPCDKAVTRFYQLFGKPVPFVFRSATNEILYMSHLDLVNARFEKDIIWSMGFYSTYDLFFAALDEDVRSTLLKSLTGALKLEEGGIKGDAEKVLEWAKGKTEADIVAAINGEDSSEIGQALANAKSNPDFLYTRNFGAGLIKLMQVVGVEPNTESSKRWAEAFGFGSKTSALTGMAMSKFESDVGIFLSSVEKMQEIMQLYADVEAREKKKVAEKLAEKAAKAAEAAGAPVEAQ